VAQLQTTSSQYAGYNTLPTPKTYSSVSWHEVLLCMLLTLTDGCVLLLHMVSRLKPSLQCLPGPLL
jgi:hypothetical protein